jgi:hypothetical protein
MNTIRTAALAAALALVSASSLGQESAAPSPAAPSPAAPSPAAAPPPVASPPPAAAQSTSPPPPPKEERGVVKGDEFIPTQEISADEAVTFPVDI